MPSTGVGEFLSSSTARSIDWPRPGGAPVVIDTVEVLFGKGDRPLEVTIATSTVAPRADDVRKLWKLRANRGAPVLLVVLYPAGGDVLASVIGTEGDPAPIQGLTRGRVERIALAALDEPNRHQAIRTLDRLLGAVSRQGLTAGVINAGLFAAHELRDGVPRRSDWEAARGRSFPLLGKTGRELLDSLGYRIEPSGTNLLALSHAEDNHAIAVVLDEQENFDRTSSRFGGVSPVSRALAHAQRERLPWVIALRRNQVRLYPADPDVGVGRKGLTETYIELDLTLLDDSDAGYLALLFSPEALVGGGSVEEILHNSACYATDLGARLRGRIYEDVVPDLAVAVARRMGAATESELDSAYHRTLIILFRLLFVAYAEDRGLLPFERNPRYTRNALKTYAKDFAEDPAQEFSPESTSIWEDLVQVWNAIDSGEPRWDVPAYNGGLFATDETHSDGAAVSALGLTNAEIGPALMAMLVDGDAQGERGPVDFRSLSVREFGTIYEGLLESSLSFAPSDLTLDREQTYVPAKEGDEVVVQAGGVYFHNASGQRKSTGSYFTKSFAVEHLLDTTLEPAITEHLERVKALIDQDDTRKRAAEDFFDFRVADLAMGSGHFLVAAIDRIEARFSAFLSENPLPAVADELARLEAVARKALGEEQGLLAEIEPSLLLRRQIARRCIYGLDINLIAVELARLAIWIHTFVPGLPMSSLDHGLVHGNSLTGIGSVEEALDVLAPPKTHKFAGAQFAQMTTFSIVIQGALDKSRTTLMKVARASEATKSEVREAALEHQKALFEAEQARLLMDAAVAVRMGLLPVPDDADAALACLAADSLDSLAAREQLTTLMPAHFPCLFPEVFVRERPGFDVVIGNPPWEKVRWEATPFWTAIYPGLTAMRDKMRDEKIEELRASYPVEAAEERRAMEGRSVLQDLFKKSFVLRGGTHLELAQLMLERALCLTGDHGAIGLVLPRQCMVLAGWKNLREALLARFRIGVVQCRNKAEWLFEDVHASYMVVFLSAKALGRDEESSVSIWPAVSRVDVEAVPRTRPLVLSRSELEQLSDTHVVPWVNSLGDMTVLDRMRRFPRLASGEGWITAEHDARWDFRGTGPDRRLVVREECEPALKVMMTAHVDQFAIDETEPVKQYFCAFEDGVVSGRGISWAKDSPHLGARHPLVVFRHPSRNDDSRTLIATALPDSGWVHNKGYVHAVRHDPASTPEQRLALLGLMNTVVEDWWARRFVDRHVTAPVINYLPLPGWSEAQIAEAADLTSALLVAHGARNLAGGIRVEVKPRLVGLSVITLLAMLNGLAAQGFGLTASDMATVLEDFSPRGVPDALRSETLVRVRA